MKPGKLMSNKKDRREIAKEDPCPCESGALYGKCCKKKKFEWHIDKKGHIYRSVKMTPEIIEVVEYGARRFKEIFGRKPGGTDRVFPDAYLMTKVDFNRDLSQAMHTANIPPEKIYATQKTERIIVDTKLFTNSELEEWNDAINK